MIFGSATIEKFFHRCDFSETLSLYLAHIPVKLIMEKASCLLLCPLTVEVRGKGEGNTEKAFCCSYLVPTNHGRGVFLGHIEPQRITWGAMLKAAKCELVSGSIDIQSVRSSLFLDDSNFTTEIILQIANLI